MVIKVGDKGSRGNTLQDSSVLTYSEHVKKVIKPVFQTPEMCL